MIQPNSAQSPLPHSPNSHPFQSLSPQRYLSAVPRSATLLLMQLCHPAHNQRRKRRSLRQRALRKNATTKRTQASRFSEIAKHHIYKADPQASGSHTAQSNPLKPEKRTHRLGSSRISIPPRPTRRIRVIQLQYLHRFSSSINYIQLSIVTPPRSVLIIVLGLRRLSRVQFRQRNTAKILSDSRGG